MKKLLIFIVLCGAAPALLTAQTPPSGSEKKASGKFPSQWFFHSSLGGTSGKDREWTLANGLKLYGSPITLGLDELQIHRESGEPPKIINLSMSDLREEDRQVARAGLADLEDRFRKYAAYQGSEVDPQWSSAKPQYPHRFRLAVDSDQDHVYFLSGNALILVDKSAFTRESLTATLEAVGKVRHQLALTNNRTSLFAFGVPVETLGQDWLMVVKQTITKTEVKFTEGMRYRLPRALLSPALDEICARVAADVQAEGEYARATQAEVPQLPRLCHTTIGLQMVLPRSLQQPGEILVLQDVGKTRQMQPHELGCSDFAWWADRNKPSPAAPKNASPVAAPSPITTSQTDLPAAALTGLVDSVSRRGLWLQDNQVPFRGRLVGLAADGFIFESSGIGKFFVPAKQLNGIDAMVAVTAMAGQGSEWLDGDKDDLQSIFARRILPDGMLADIGNEVIKGNGAFLGDLPVVTYAGSKDNRVQLDKLSTIVAVLESQRWCRENAELLASANPKDAVQKLAIKYPHNIKSSPTKLLPSHEVRAWRLAAGSTLDAALVGQYQGDYVFETKVDGQVYTYRVDPKALDQASRGEATKLAQRFEAKDWQEALTRHANWQNYRVGIDPNGLVRHPTLPVVVLSVSDALVVFESFGGKRFSEPMPRDPARQEATREAFEAALERGREQRGAAEAILSRWSFEDAEPVVHAELIGLAENAILVRDVNAAEFLINKSTLSVESRTKLDSLARSISDLRQLSSDDTWALPRVWCTRTEIVGPAIPEYLTDNDKQLVIQQASGNRQVLKLEDLTLREQLSFITAWRLKHGTLKKRRESLPVETQQTVDSILSADIPAADQLTQVPEIQPEIKRRIEAAFQDWKHTVWTSNPIPLPRDSQLLCVNADATAGVVSMPAGWHVVDFKSGTTQLVRSIDKGEQIKLGPWMGSDIQNVWWIENGQLQCYLSNTVATKLNRDMSPVVAACQSGDFQSIVLLLNDHSVRRVDLGNQQVEMVVPAEKIGASPAPGGTIWASENGRSVFLARGTSGQLFANSPPGEEVLTAYLGSQQSPVAVVVGQSQAWFGAEPTPRALHRLTASTTLLPPTTYGLAYPAQWMGAVNLNDREVFQAIGRFEDTHSQSQDRYFVTYRGPRDFFEEFPTQLIEGKVDDRARMAAGGAALVHWQGSQPVVSRRPLRMPRAPELVIYEIVEELVERRDIGQLEATHKLLNGKPYSDFGPHYGWWSLRFQKSVDTAALHYQEQLGGDGLARAMQLAKHFQRRFPDSQVAANILASLELGLAWKARGGGFADSVTQAGMEAFQHHMEQASELLVPWLTKSPSAATLDSVIDVAMGTGDMKLAKRTAGILNAGPHLRNTNLQHSMCFLLLPRWHGKPGAAEIYRDSAAKELDGDAGNILYAQLVLDMFDVHGGGQPVSQVMRVDPERVVKGVEAYYKTQTHPDLIDRALVFTAIERQFDLCKRLLKLKQDKQLLPSSVIARSPLNFRTIERELGQ